MFRIQLEHPLENFDSVLKDPRQWKKLENIEEKIKIGHANSHFLFGIGTCTYQDSGSYHCPNSQWAFWEEKKILQDNRSGKSADFFELYKTQVGLDQITDKLKLLGVNSYRFSIEWSQIEPEEGRWSDENLLVYVNLCKHLRNHGIVPMITLHHFSEPLWFHNKGSFEKEENIDYFICFARKVFPELTQIYHEKPLVEYFCTINEPAIEAFSRFILGSFSPGIRFDFKRAAHFLRNILKAHCLVYETLKQRTSANIKIGIVHQYLKFIPTNPLLSPMTSYFNRLVNEAPFRFFSTGRFEFKIPFVKVIDSSMPKAVTDFVGLQYYGRPLIGIRGSISCNAPMTQMPLREDPEGLYEAIIDTYKFYRAPIVVTENGISTHDEVQRERYLSRALYAAQRAVEKIGKENFLGYYLWCFFDNFEWDKGMKPQAFGAFSLDGVMKKGVQIYSRILKQWKSTW